MFTLLVELPTFVKDIIFKEISSGPIIQRTIVSILEIYKLNKEFKIWFSSICPTVSEIEANWINITVGNSTLDNTFPWHDDRHNVGKFLGILWVSGSENCGGDLSVINDSAEVISVPFKPNTLILMPTHWIHRVEHYWGKDLRVSLNFTYDEIITTTNNRL